MEREKIVVLGGSFLQSDFIQLCIDLGHQVYVLDGDKNCYTSNWDSIHFQHINFSNETLVKEFCKENDIDIVYAPCNEIGNLVTARLAKSLGLRYNSENAVLITLDKYKQRKAASKLKNIYSPKSIRYSGNIGGVESTLQYPLVIKPTNLSAGRGITGVNNRQELIQALEEAERFLKPGGEIMVEEFIDGDQISVETISVDGEHHIAGITLEIVSPAPLFIERCHYMNAEIHELYYNRIKSGVEELLNKIGIKWGPCHIELKVNENKVGLIEIASRMGGLRDRLMNLAGYPDYNKLILSVYMNGQIDKSLLKPPTGNSLVNILTKPDDIKSIVLGRRDNTIHSLFLYEKGPVYNPQNIMDAYGYAYFKSDKELKPYSVEQY